MNEMNPDEWRGYIADFFTLLLVIAVAAIVTATMFLIVVREPVTLFNEPCAPSHPVMNNERERIACTGDSPSSDSWYPGIQP